jgi:hypothetical protein
VVFLLHQNRPRSDFATYMFGSEQIEIPLSEGTGKMCLTERREPGDSGGDRVGARSGERVPPPRASHGRRKLNAGRRGAQWRAAGNPFQILGEIGEDESVELVSGEEVAGEAGTGARPSSSCLGDFLALALEGAAGDGSSPARLVAEAPDLRPAAWRNLPMRLDSEVDFPSLLRSGGGVGQLVSQAQEERWALRLRCSSARSRSLSGRRRRRLGRWRWSS